MMKFGLLSLLSSSAAMADSSTLTAMVDEYLTMSITLDDPDADAEAQNQDLRGDLVDMHDSLSTIEAHMEALLAEDAQRWSLEIEVRRAQLYEHFGNAISSSDEPSFLTRKQSRVYRVGLEAKAETLYTKSHDAYRAALALAEQQGRDDELRSAARSGARRVGKLSAPSSP